MSNIGCGDNNCLKPYTKKESEDIGKKGANNVINDGGKSNSRVKYGIYDCQGLNKQSVFAFAQEYMKQKSNGADITKDNIDKILFYKSDLTSDQKEKLFNAVNVNKDGKIDVQELAAFFSFQDTAASLKGIGSDAIISKNDQRAAIRQLTQEDKKNEIEKYYNNYKDVSKETQLSTTNTTNSAPKEKTAADYDKELKELAKKIDSEKDETKQRQLEKEYQKKLAAKEKLEEKDTKTRKTKSEPKTKTTADYDKELEELAKKIDSEENETKQLQLEKEYQRKLAAKEKDDKKEEAYKVQSGDSLWKIVKAHYGLTSSADIWKKIAEIKEATNKYKQEHPDDKNIKAINEVNLVNNGATIILP